MAGALDDALCLLLFVALLQAGVDALLVRFLCVDLRQVLQALARRGALGPTGGGVGAALLQREVGRVEVSGSGQVWGSTQGRGRGSAASEWRQSWQGDCHAAAVDSRWGRSPGRGRRCQGGPSSWMGLAPAAAGGRRAVPAA